MIRTFFNLIISDQSLISFTRTTNFALVLNDSVWICYSIACHLIQGGQMKSGQILSQIYSKTVLNIIFKFYTLVTKYISCLRSQSQHNGYKFWTSGRVYVEGG
jgi:hypothetical protein